MTATRDVDVVIVGGGPAGISTALHLQAAAPRRAERAVVLEKKRYPRDKICAGAVGGRALRRLEALGVDLDVPYVPMDVIAMRVGSDVVSVREPGLGVVVRRIELDHALARQALARGIEVRDGCGVTAIAIARDHVVVETDAGDRYRARAIVGADGVAGIVRRQAGFPRGELRAQVVEVDTAAAPGDLPRDTLVFDFATRDLKGYAWDFPTIVAGEPLVCRGVYAIKSLAVDETKTRLDTYLAARGLDPAAHRYKHFAERGFEPGAAIAAPRVLLVGEAAGIDIATGEGIAQAIEYGAVAGPYLARALADDALDFADWRARVARHHVGWQLRIRHACYRVFYGSRRARIEQLLPQLAALMRVGTQDFAGIPISKLALARGAMRLFAGLAREGLRPRNRENPR